MLIDVHAHMLSKAFDGDRDAVLERNKDVIIVENGVNYEDNVRALALAKKYTNVRAALGLYPTEVVRLSDEMFIDNLKFLEKHKEEMVAIGEIGLDLQEIESITLQRDRFVEIVELAKKLGKPVIVHSRKAEKEAVEALESVGAKKVVMHCFCGNMKLVKRIEDNGWYITIPALIETSKHFQVVAERVSSNQLLTETDSPHLNPIKTERNEPKNVFVAIKKIAEIKKCDIDEVMKNIFMNAQKLFFV
ncbi:MAG TPA: TatD family hydrolase [Candidatus Nanoarchaeia archaeon]|nr:TatD family hydrolase [Candidatus Nanoarchaeia archaeon]